MAVFLKFYLLSIIFYLIPFLEFININYSVLDKSTTSVLFYIFLSLFLFLILLNFLLNKIKFFYNGFYIFFKFLFFY